MESRFDVVVKSFVNAIMEQYGLSNLSVETQHTMLTTVLNSYKSILKTLQYNSTTVSPQAQQALRLCLGNLPEIVELAIEQVSKINNRIVERMNVEKRSVHIPTSVNATLAEACRMSGITIESDADVITDYLLPCDLEIEVRCYGRYLIRQADRWCVLRVLPIVDSQDGCCSVQQPAAKSEQVSPQVGKCSSKPDATVKHVNSQVESGLKDIPGQPHLTIDRLIAECVGMFATVRVNPDGSHAG